MDSNAQEDEFLTETTAILPINYDGIGPIDIRDGMVYVTFWARQQKADGSGFERVVVGRAVSRYAIAQAGIFQMGRAMARVAMFGNPMKTRWEGH